MLGHFGFSYIGLLFLVMLMVPNLIWTKKQPGVIAQMGKINALVC